jgi:hypothetical protein
MNERTQSLLTQIESANCLVGGGIEFVLVNHRGQKPASSSEPAYRWQLK